MRNSNDMMINDDVLAGNETLHQQYELSFLVLALCHVNEHYIHLHCKMGNNREKEKLIARFNCIPIKCFDRSFDFALEAQHT